MDEHKTRGRPKARTRLDVKENCVSSVGEYSTANGGLWKYVDMKKYYANRP